MQHSDAGNLFVYRSKNCSYVRYPVYYYTSPWMEYDSIRTYENEDDFCSKDMCWMIFFNLLILR